MRHPSLALLLAGLLVLTGCARTSDPGTQTSVEPEVVDLVAGGLRS